MSEGTAGLCSQPVQRTREELRPSSEEALKLHQVHLVCPCVLL